MLLFISMLNTPHNIISKQLVAFLHILLTHWWKTYDACHSDLLSNVGKNVSRAGVRTKKPWIDSSLRYRLNFHTNKQANTGLYFKRENVLEKQSQVIFVCMGNINSMISVTLMSIIPRESLMKSVHQWNRTGTI